MITGTWCDVESCPDYADQLAKLEIQVVMLSREPKYDQKKYHTETFNLQIKMKNLLFQSNENCVEMEF